MSEYDCAMSSHRFLTLAAPRLAPNLNLSGALLAHRPRAVSIAALRAGVRDALVRFARAVLVRRAVGVLLTWTLLFSHRTFPLPLRGSTTHSDT